MSKKKISYNKMDSIIISIHWVKMSNSDILCIKISKNTGTIIVLYIIRLMSNLDVWYNILY